MVSLVASIYFATRSNVKNPLLFAKRSILTLSVLISVFAIPLFISMTYMTNLVYYTLAMTLFGAFGVMTNTPISVLFQTAVDEAYRGRVIGLLEMMAMGLMPIGMVVYGLLFDFVPAEYLFIGSSLLLIPVINMCINRKVLDQVAKPDSLQQEELNEKMA